MSAFWIILITLVFDWGLGSLLAYYRKKMEEARDDTFIARLENIFQNSKTDAIRKENALELCRRTKGKLSSGAYIAIQEWPIK